MTTAEKVQTPRKSPPLINRIMARLLGSAMSRVVDPGIMLLTVFGRRTGRPYTFPVEYVQDGEVVWVFVGDGGNKTWWRNLVDGGAVELLLRRRRREGHGVAFTYGDDPGVVEEGLRRYLQRFPKRGKLVGASLSDHEAFAAAATRTTIVRIHLESDHEA